MSLKDTIEGARREAEGNVVGAPKKEAEAAAPEDEKRGFSRSSAAKAKPVREAGASVRPSAKPAASGGLFGLGGSESKEEKQERRRKEREADDLRNSAYDAVLREDDSYSKTERVFWVIVGVGFALGVVSLVMAYVYGEQQTDLTTWQGIVSVGSLVIAYGCIFAGIIYDFAKRRPLRRQAQMRVSGLSDKKLLELVERDRERRAKSGKKR